MADVNDLRKFCLGMGISGQMFDSYGSYVSRNMYLEPTVIEERDMSMTSLSVFSRLMMDRVVFVTDEINSDAMNILTAQLLWLDQQSEKPVSMYINSPGGSVVDGLQLIDTINIINAPVSTTCMGMAASMGAVILSCGEMGQRFVLPHSRVMLHQASGGCYGKSSDVKTSYEQLMRCQKDVYEILAGNMGKSYDEIEDLCSSTDKWFIGQEAVDLGIVDKVVTKQ